MLKQIGTGLIALGLAWGSIANALTLDCKNVTTEPIAVAVSYLDLDGKTWYVDGWYNLLPNQQANIELDSNNNFFYIYGEFESGIEVKGGEGSLALPIYYKTFKYIQGQQPDQQPDNVVQFVRGVASDGVAKVTFGPIHR